MNTSYSSRRLSGLLVDVRSRLLAGVWVARSRPSPVIDPGSWTVELSSRSGRRPDPAR